MKESRYVAGAARAGPSRLRGAAEPAPRRVSVAIRDQKLEAIHIVTPLIPRRGRPVAPAPARFQSIEISLQYHFITIDKLK